MRYAADAPAIVLSPHIDDAVLSAWAVLDAPGDVAVVNVFAGVPDPTPVPRWDRLAGARDSRAHMRARLEEDRAALALAGRTAHYLPFLDRQYRREPPAGEELAAALDALVSLASALHAPAGIGGHEDHKLVRDVAFELSRQVRLPLTLYAELPYAVRFGWPSWVTGAAADPAVVVDVDWDNALDSAPVARSALGSQVRRLDAQQASAKLAAMRCYRTQFPLLNGGPIGWLEHPQVLPWEVGFAVAPGDA